MAMLLVATLVSTVASLGGGLVLYFQGLEALEDSVRETSVGEIHTVRDHVVSVFDKVRNSSLTMQRFLFSTDILRTNTSPPEWEGTVRSLAFAQVSGSSVLYSSGIELLPVRQGDPDEVFYSGVWVEHAHSNTLIHGSYGGAVAPSVSYSEGKAVVRVACSTLTAEGSIANKTYSYTTELGSYGAFPDRTEIVTVPMQRASVAGPVSAFQEFVTYYRAPKSPHPWSRYQWVAVRVGFFLSAWQDHFDVLNTASWRSSDVSVLLIDKQNGMVLAASSSPAGSYCTEYKEASYDTELLRCMVLIEDLPRHMQEAYNTMQGLKNDAFSKQSLHGDEYFLRRVTLSTHGRRLEIIWMRPASIVQFKVREALWLLIAFTGMVLLFDAFITVVEIAFIALPLRRVSTAIREIGDMKLDQAAAEVTQHTGGVMLKEMRLLSVGMVEAVQRLQQYRKFIPPSVLSSEYGMHCGPDAEGEGGEEEEGLCAEQSVPHSLSHSLTSVYSMPGNVTQATQKSSVKSSPFVFELFLVTKSVSLLAVNVVGWQRAVGGGPDSRLLESHADIVTTVIQTTSAFRGVVDTFIADRFLVGWNTSKAKKGDSTLSCVTTAMHLSVNLAQYTLSTAATSGKVRIGNLGNKVLRRHTVLSPLIALLYEMEAYCKVFGHKCIVDDRKAHRLDGVFDYVVREGLHTKNLGVVPVSSITGPSKVLEGLSGPPRHTGARNTFARNVITQRWDDILKVPDDVHEIPHLVTAYQEREFTPFHQAFGRDETTRGTPELPAISPPKRNAAPSSSSEGRSHERGCVGNPLLPPSSR